MRPQRTLLTKYDFQDIFKAYTSTTYRLNVKYELELQRIAEQGIKILEKMIDDYLITKKEPKKPEIISITNEGQSGFKKEGFYKEEAQNCIPEQTIPIPQSNGKMKFSNDALCKKEFIVQQEWADSTPRKGILFHKKKKAKPEVEIKIKKSRDNQQLEDEVLQDIKKMSMDDRFSFGTATKQKVEKFLQKGENMAKKVCFEQKMSKSKKFAEDDAQPDQEQAPVEYQGKQNNPGNQMYDSDRQIPEHIKKQSLFELIEQTNRKIKEAAQQQKTHMSALQRFLLDDEGCTYQMTDYSSNESSNDDNYDNATQMKPQLDYQHLERQMKSDKPLFGGMFSSQENIHPSSQESNSANDSNMFKTLQNFPQSMNSLTFIPVHIQHSSLLKSAKKTNQTKRLYIKNKKIPKWAEDLANVKKIEIMQRNINNPLEIFGYICIQQVDSNRIFKLRDAYRRFSSAKWRNKELFVV